MPARKIKEKRYIRASDGKGSRALELDERADTGLRLLREIKEGVLDARDLSRTQRKACLVLMANGKQTSAEMATILATKPSTVRRMLQEIRKERGREVSQWTTDEVLGQMAWAKERCQARAMAQDDPGLAWSIERDFVKLLKELGVVGDKAETEGVRVTIEALGRGYERATETLGQALNPVLTGQVVDVEHQGLSTQALPPLEPAPVEPTKPPLLALPVPMTVDPLGRSPGVPFAVPQKLPSPVPVPLETQASGDPP